MDDEIKEMEYPYVPDSIIIYLEKAFPDKLPKEEISAFNLGKEVGKQEIIQHLKTIKKWSEEKDV